MEAALNGSSASASADAGAALTCTIGGEPVTLERLSARKSSRALAQLRALSKKVPLVQSAIAKYTIEYERENFIEYDPVQARMAFPPQVLATADGEPIFEPPEVDGNPNPKAGELMLGPSPVDLIPKEAWDAAGGKYRRPKSPSWPEVAFAVLDVALEEAEHDVYALLALFLMPNDEVKEVWKSGNWKAELDARAEELLDTAFGDEVLTLAVACSEIVDDQFVKKARSLGARLGNLGRLVGIDPASLNPTTTTGPTSTPEDEPSLDGPSPSTPTSSTPSDEPTDGDPTTPSTLPGSLSTSSSDDSDETESLKSFEPKEEAIPT